MNGLGKLPRHVSIHFTVLAIEPSTLYFHTNKTASEWTVFFFRGLIPGPVKHSYSYKHLAMSSQKSVASYVS